MIDLQTLSQVMKVMAEPSRVRLLALLDREELTVAELAAITLMPQPRVSTHLGKLRDACLVKDRKAGVHAFYRYNANQLDDSIKELWQTMSGRLEDGQLQSDLDRLPAVLSARAREQRWADSVAGDMERHYSPGRTWESTARMAFKLLNLGDVLDVASGDGVMAELLSPRSRSVTCVDVSQSVVDAARQRLKAFENTEVRCGDMHALPFDDGSFDLAILNHALTYTTTPDAVLAELHRVVKPGGQLLVATLNAHDLEAAVQPYDHVNYGFSPQKLSRLVATAGFTVDEVGVINRELKPPHFEVVAAKAIRS